MSIKYLIASLGTAFILVSCTSESAKDIKTSDIKDVCDCVNSLQMVVDELSILKEEDPTSENKTQMAVLKSKLKEIRNHCYTQFKVDKMTECDGFKQLEKDIDALR